MAELYRTPRTSRGFGRKLGGLHMHGDASKSAEGLQEMVEAIVRELNVKAKTSRVTDFRDGPQRKNPSLSDIYDEHTPGTEQEDGVVQEEFAGFATITLNELADIDTIRNHIRRFLEEQPGSVVEVERTIAMIDHVSGSIRGRLRRSKELKNPTGQLLDPDLLLEVHHGIDVQGVGEDSPLSLDRACRILSEVKVPDAEGRLGPFPWGGAFLFEKPDRNPATSSIRVNIFRRGIEGLEEELRAQYVALNKALQAADIQYQYRAQVEAVLHIFRDVESLDALEPLS